MSADTQPNQQQILIAIRQLADAFGRPPSRNEFREQSGYSEYQVLLHFPSWNEAMHAAGMTPHASNRPVDQVDLLKDWGEVVRRLRRIPTRDQYRREGSFSPGSFEKKLGTWSSLPSKFRERFVSSTEWNDVIALLPSPGIPQRVAAAPPTGDLPRPDPESKPQHATTSSIMAAKVSGKQVYGKPIDFRGLRHEPINEQGVVFLFGMLAHELGFYVEAIQTGFPDCEAKRQVGPAQWQRVSIEFEYMSRTYTKHLHEPVQADMIVCWKHNWPECPPEIEVFELALQIRGLPSSADIDE